MANVNRKVIRVLVVDDSAFMRKIITDILSSDEEVNVIGSARNGAEALEKCKELEPDVITLDVEMPLMDGLTCLKELLKIKKIPVIMLSSITREGADATIQALEYGAIDFITKPTNIFSMSGEEKKKEIVEKVKIASSTALKGQVIEKKEAYRPRPFSAAKPVISPNICTELNYLVAIGTSTGGPKALQDVIPLIPADAPAAFLVVQHMPPGFTRSLAERLNSLSEVVVKEAENMEQIKPGVVYIAPGDYHMMVERTRPDNCLRIKLTQDPPAGGHRPAVNVMMNSVPSAGIKNVAGVIMTGMGSDGSEGVKNLKLKNDAYIIAQDEKTCVVYGMPKMAVQTGTVDIVVPLKDITKEVMKFMGVHI